MLRPALAVVVGLVSLLIASAALSQSADDRSAEAPVKEQRRRVDQYGRRICAQPFQHSECFVSRNAEIRTLGEQRTQGRMVMLRVVEEDTGREGWISKLVFDVLEPAPKRQRPRTTGPLIITPVPGSDR